jgi:adenylate cyclase
VEIERKFLVKPELLPKLPKGKRIVQGYLSLSPCVRVRIEDGKKAWLTIKGPGLFVREEYEYRIPLPDAKKMMALCLCKIEKTRRRMGRWEIDEFKEPKGLWLAEIELETPHQSDFDLPECICNEVTTNSKYANVNLAAEATIARLARKNRKEK